MTRTLRALWLLLLAAVLASPSAAEAKPRTISLVEVDASPPSLMVAQKIETPLVLVLDPARIAEPWEANRRMTVTDWPTFVSRDLKDALEDHFAKVTVQRPETPMPDGPHLIAHVKIDRVQFRPIEAGGLTYNVIQMQWGFAIKRAGDAEYTFSYAGTASSAETYQNIQVGLGQLIENAISGLLAAWTEKGVSALLRAP